MPAEHWTPRPIGEPWLAFLREIDRALESSVTLHCIGGFALSVLIDMPRPTGDIDFVEILARDGGNQLLGIGGEGSAIARKYSLHLQHVTIVDSPCDYADRLIDVTPAELIHLRLLILDPYDLIRRILTMLGWRWNNSISTGHACGAGSKTNSCRTSPSLRKRPNSPFSYGWMNCFRSDLGVRPVRTRFRRIPPQNREARYHRSVGQSASAR